MQEMEECQGSQLGVIWPPQGDLQQCLEVFLVVLTGEEDPTGIQWVEARDAANILQYTRLISTTKTYVLPRSQKK